MKADLGQLSGKQHSYYSGIFQECFLCVCERGYLSYLAGIFGHYCVEYEEYEMKLER